MTSNAYNVPVNSHLVSTTWLLTAPTNIIIPRDVSGKPDPQYPPKQPPHFDYSINICRGMMNHTASREAYERFATRYSIGRPNSWYLQGPNPMTMNQVSQNFIEDVLVQFPAVVKDYALKNPDYKGFHTRRPHNGDFKPAHQAISVNAYMIDQMSIAYDEMAKNLKDLGRQHTFRAFMFKTANTLYHEMAHVFVTYLTKGQRLTPPQINDPTVEVSESGGEAGRAMEVLLFGGMINYFRAAPSSGPASEGPASEGPASEGPASGRPASEGPASEGPASGGPASGGPATEGPATEGPASEGPASEGPASKEPAGRKPTSETLVYQCGTAYLKKESGGFYRILPKTIDDTVSFQFKFPYEHEQSSERQELIRLGEGFAPDVYTDPLERIELAYLLQ